MCATARRLFLGAFLFARGRLPSHDPLPSLPLACNAHRRAYNHEGASFPLSPDQSSALPHKRGARHSHAKAKKKKTQIISRRLAQISPILIGTISRRKSTECMTCVSNQAVRSVLFVYNYLQYKGKICFFMFKATWRNLQGSPQNSRRRCDRTDRRAFSS